MSSRDKKTTKQGWDDKGKEELAQLIKKVQEVDPYNIDVAYIIDVLVDFID